MYILPTVAESKALPVVDILLIINAPNLSAAAKKGFPLVGPPEYATFAESPSNSFGA